MPFKPVKISEFVFTKDAFLTWRCEGRWGKICGLHFDSDDLRELLLSRLKNQMSRIITKYIYCIPVKANNSTLIDTSLNLLMVFSGQYINLVKVMAW